MMFAGQAQYFRGASPFITRDQEKHEGAHDDSALKVSIPDRYRDGKGGVDLEQVRRDQRRARGVVMRAALLRLRGQG